MMEEILSLIRSKNRCLERLSNASHALLSIPTEKMAEEIDGTSPLELYDNERSSIIRTLELYDRKINEFVSTLPTTQKSMSFIENVKLEMNKNEQLLNAVFESDDIVFKKIAEAQRRVSLLLGENRKNRETLSKFKSTWMSEGGESVDKTL